MAEIATHHRLADWERDLKLPGFTVRCYDSVGSTMDLGRSLASELSDGSLGLVLARSQTAGRGRQGRQWIPPQSGLYTTAVLRTEGGLESLSGLSLAVGVVMADVVQSFGAEVLLKWPNDLWSVRSDKMGGILVEASGGMRSATALVGIGLNLAGEPQAVPGTTSLYTLSGQSVTPTQFVNRLAPALADGWREFTARGFTAFHERFLARAALLGQQISLDHGGVQESGVFQGVDVSGALQVLTSAGLVSRASGEVKNVRPVGG